MSIHGQIRSATTTIVAKVDNNNGRLSAAQPVTVKNQIQEIRSIQDLPDVDEVNVVDGATLVYNSATDKYEVKLIDLGASGLDGGTF